MRRSCWARTVRAARDAAQAARGAGFRRAARAAPAGSRRRSSTIRSRPSGRAAHGGRARSTNAPRVRRDGRPARRARASRRRDQARPRPARYASRNRRRPAACDAGETVGVAGESMPRHISETARIRRKTHAESRFDSTCIRVRKARSFGGRASAGRTRRNAGTRADTKQRCRVVIRSNRFGRIGAHMVSAAGRTASAGASSSRSGGRTDTFGQAARHSRAACVKRRRAAARVARRARREASVPGTANGSARGPPSGAAARRAPVGHRP